MSEPTPDIPRLYDLIAVDSTDSSRAHAERLAVGGAEEGTVVWTKSQREGLGRAGNYWMSGNRNLHCAIILRPEGPLELCCQLSLLSTICAAMGISRQAEPLEEFRYRWPNDIILNQGKVAGITLSGKLYGAVVKWMVVSLNVNVYDHPYSKGFDAASMRGEGFQSFDRVQLLEAYTREFLSWINRWSEEGFEPIRKAWLFRGHQKNDPVRISLEDSDIVGTFDELSPTGAIKLATHADTETIKLSDFFRPDFSS
ncbi:MAG: biotin--[acetyl-CoA-carboxylase] ligase [Arenicellales bacterium]|nr:biotin--[acetyl-CoA-carboxylase] ligase [Arenicellales bacterium]